MRTKFLESNYGIILMAGIFLICSSSINAQTHVVLAHIWLYENSRVESDAYLDCLENASPAFSDSRGAFAQMEKAINIMCEGYRARLIKKLVEKSSKILNIDESKREAEFYASAINGCIFRRITAESAPVCEEIFRNRK